VYDPDFLERVQIYQTGMDHEAGVVTHYQGLIATLETALLALFTTLYELSIMGQIWILAFMGILIGVSFGVAGEYRLRNVDIWRKHIVALVAGTDLESVFRESKYRWSPFGKTWLQSWAQRFAGHWFERIVLTLIIGVWIYILWVFPSPCLLRILSPFVAVFWVIYVFDILKLRGGWMS
jgi:hypothetical protein